MKADIKRFGRLDKVIDVSGGKWKGEGEKPCNELSLGMAGEMCLFSLIQTSKVVCDKILPPLDKCLQAQVFGVRMRLYPCQALDLASIHSLQRCQASPKAPDVLHCFALPTCHQLRWSLGQSPSPWPSLTPSLLL